MARSSWPDDLEPRGRPGYHPRITGGAVMTETAIPTAVAAPTDTLFGELEPTGPRAGADRGQPETWTRVIFQSPDGRMQVGVWQCTPGGWAIVDRPDTETVHILEGRARITDADGGVHDLSEGDAIVLPKGWSGRWDIVETVRKLYVTVAG
jgi:uncharacterized cupin superfamily protein